MGKWFKHVGAVLVLMACAGFTERAEDKGKGECLTGSKGGHVIDQLRSWVGKAGGRPALAHQL